jgi:hypothetical protein
MATHEFLQLLPAWNHGGLPPLRTGTVTRSAPLAAAIARGHMHAATRSKATNSARQCTPTSAVAKGNRTRGRRDLVNLHKRKSASGMIVHKLHWQQGPASVARAVRGSFTHACSTVGSSRPRTIRSVPAALSTIQGGNPRFWRITDYVWSLSIPEFQSDQRSRS